MEPPRAPPAGPLRPAQVGRPRVLPALIPVRSAQPEGAGPRRGVALLAWLLFAPFPARALDAAEAERLLAQGTLRLSQGRPTEALEAFGVVARSPEPPQLRPYGLAGRAEAEEALGRYDDAERDWRGVLQLAPTGRVAARAGARLNHLIEGRKGGDEPLRRYRAVLEGYAQCPPAESLRRMEAVVQGWPDFPWVDRALLWIGDEGRSHGAPGEAETALREFLRRWPDHPERARALSLLGDALFLEGKQAEALEVLGRLEAEPDPAWGRIGRDKAALVRAEIPRRRWMRVSVLVLAGTLLALAGFLARPALQRRSPFALRRLRLGLSDAAWATGILSVLTLIGSFQGAVVGRALAWLAAGALPWLTALSLAARSTEAKGARLALAGGGLLGSAAGALLIFESYRLGVVGFPSHFSLAGGAVGAEVSALLWGAAGTLGVASAAVPFFRASPPPGGGRRGARAPA